MKFGVREICDVTFKATDERYIGTKLFKKHQPVFMIDTARTSTLEQATTTVYAQGGKGYARLIAWEGEKTMTFTVEDALISPMGLAVLTGAGLIGAEEEAQHVHITYDVEFNKSKEAEITLAGLQNELGITDASVEVCVDNDDVPIYGTVLDGSGAGINWIADIEATGETGKYDDTVTVDAEHPVKFTYSGDENVSGKAVRLDFYVYMTKGVQEVDIKPESFGGFFYVEADTLYRREDTGADMAATITLPRVKVQSAFTFTMSASGDPSTFTFTMDAFPGYTMFDKTKKVMCVMQIVGTDGVEGEAEVSHSAHDPK